MYVECNQAYTVIQSSLQQGKLGGASDTEKQKQLFMAYLNNAETGTEYLNRLQVSIQVCSDIGFVSWFVVDI